MPHMQCDKGATKHILSGSDIMCPGLTHPNARMDDVKEGAIVAVMCEGKENAAGIGMMTMSTEQVRKENKGIAITNVLHLNDGMWKLIRTSNM